MKELNQLIKAKEKKLKVQYPRLTPKKIQVLSRMTIAKDLHITERRLRQIVSEGSPPGGPLQELIRMRYLQKGI